MHDLCRRHAIQVASGCFGESSGSIGFIYGVWGVFRLSWGQNVVRAALTGALRGATVGLSGIPQRWIDNLERGNQLLEIARAVAGHGNGGVAKSDE